MISPAAVRRPNLSGGTFGYAQSPAADPQIAADDEQPAEQAPFLCHGGKNEIGVAFGQIVEMALRAVEKTLAEDPAGTDGDLRLGDVIACAERVAFGIQENGNALLLISVQGVEIE